MDKNREAVDEYFGQVVHDRFRWLESASAESRDWLTREGERARQMLDALPGLGEMRSRIQAHSDEGDEIDGLQIAGGRVFYLRRAAGEPMARLCVRRLGGPERTLFQLPAGQPAAISQVSPSPDGKLVAFAVASGGTEDNTIHFMDVDAGAELPERMEHVGYVALSWVPGRGEFYYRRYPEHLNPDPGKRRLNSQVWLHTLNAPTSEDHIVFGSGVATSPELAPDDIVDVRAYPGSPYELACVHHGTSSDVTLYARKATERERPWRQVVASEDAVGNWSLTGRMLYVISRRDEALGRVMAVDLDAQRAARTLLATDGRKLVDVESAGDAVYVLDEDLAGSRVRRLRVSDGSVATVALPFEASVNEFKTGTGSDGLFLQIEGWADSPRWLSVEPVHLTTSDPFPDQRKISSPGLHVEHLTARSKDGTSVPLTVVWRESTRKPGVAPTLLQGYGAYEVSIRPYFATSGALWLDRGGIVAFAHVRGGGELGRDWHLAAVKERKQKSVDDFLACAEEIVDRGYSEPAQLAIAGQSAGGLLVGMAMVERPDLFRAVYIRSGMVDVLRLSKTEIGPSNAHEFGSPDSPTGFQALLSMDVYQQVKDGTRYPAVLAEVGLNDIRVPSWQGAKLVARLHEASTSQRLVLLDVDAERGHAGTTARQDVRVKTDMFAFILSQLGPGATGASAAAR